MHARRKPIRSLTLDDPTLRARVSLQLYDPKARAYRYRSARSVRFAMGQADDADVIWGRVVSLLRQLQTPDEPERPGSGPGDGTMAVAGARAAAAR